MTRTVPPEIRRIYDRTYAAGPGNKIKLRCRERCAYAIKTGRLVRRPCEKCGLAKSEAHHEDYSKPFDVKWLCRKCHLAVHLATPVGLHPFRSLPRTHCPQGHAYAGDNIGMNGPARRCRECHRVQVRAYKRRKIEQAVVSNQL